MEGIALDQGAEAEDEIVDLLRLEGVLGGGAVGDHLVVVGVSQQFDDHPPGGGLLDLRGHGLGGDGADPGVDDGTLGTCVVRHDGPVRGKGRFSRDIMAMCLVQGEGVSPEWSLRVPISALMPRLCDGAGQTV
ncbi:hypothetical protein [Leifsonia xyli]|uniref:hypothetical protein n=1 Tax=Leifsonia xyli TaxID=1575 RepID=UPI00114CD6E5|nr:hypothetical protein [Leifsonia xyli]